MYTFNDLEWRLLNGGKQGIKFFPNGYGISVVNHQFSYTHGDDDYEIAVLVGKDDKHFRLTYDTPITDDVIGYQSVDDVNEVMKQIQELPNHE